MEVLRNTDHAFIFTSNVTKTVKNERKGDFSGFSRSILMIFCV